MTAHVCLFISETVTCLEMLSPKERAAMCPLNASAMEIANSANVIPISPHGQANHQVVDHGPVSRIASLPLFRRALQ
jgi:hypothetical protein